jgi:hypothetical protein
MSGIFKSVKKAFKKVGKVIKKIAPVLIVASAVYFGGAYLMASSGAGTAAAGASVTYGAEGVGAAFTKSAGVWKSFIGGLSSGTASKSAVAFAEGSFKASQAGMALSGQVAAGTASVNNLATMGTVREAVNAGVNMAESAFSSGADPQSSWNILWNGLNDPTAPAIETIGEGVGEAASEASPAGSLLSPEQTAELESGLFDQSTYMADASESPPGAISTDSAVASGGYQPSLGDPATYDPNFTEPYVAPPPAPQGLLTSPAETPSTMTYMTEMIARNQELTLEGIRAQNDIMKEQIAARASADKMKLGLTAGGMILNVLGQSQQASAAEKERNRSRNFVPHKTSYNPYEGIV